MLEGSLGACRPWDAPNGDLYGMTADENAVLVRLRRLPRGGEARLRRGDRSVLVWRTKQPGMRYVLNPKARGNRGLNGGMETIGARTAVERVLKKLGGVPE